MTDDRPVWYNWTLSFKLKEGGTAMTIVTATFRKKCEVKLKCENNMKLSIQTKELPFSTVLYLLDHAIAWFVINAPGVEAKDDMFNKFVEQLKEPGVGMMMIAESYDGLEGSRLMFYTNKNVLYAVMLPGSDLR